ncbi:type VII toxin-antitoxin system HepT family RNase toxin [Actinomycetospora termitidis]|uniref:DUF86 domain-containing protein n=1 Tax=Actinomycetospora termitidis TaxID=3053470 RepID=A0ABT7MBV5_9PSEU|nr:DUF86 domain-containing protein [Actinomycetospora sp. Odt1-22]MDL5157649.1 DUF86 domain-containing protein [Actinomycetospora sp. Odt1-22]
MTPRSLDWRSVEPKLRRIEELLAVLEGFLPLDGGVLRTDLRTALAVERALSLVVELAVSVNGHVVVALTGRAPETYAASFERAEELGVFGPELSRALVPSAKMRNILVHMYLEVDHDIVAAAVPLAVEQYRDYVRQVARWFVAHDPER